MDLEILSFVESQVIGQLNARERQLLVAAVGSGPRKTRAALEVGTWLGGGSTAHILETLEKNGAGHLWGIESDRGIYEKMIQNLQKLVPGALHRFTPLFGFSQKMIPQLLAQQPPGFEFDFVFLDGGDNPMEQVIEFRLVDPHMPVGSVLMAHDARLRKGKWLGPYLARLDHWESEVHDISDEGLLCAKKIAAHPSEKSLRNAGAALFKLRCEPIEVVAAITPRKLCGLAIKLLPQRLARSLAGGHKKTQA
jgi:predicted O-methyltransferase YrrM